MEYFFLSIPFFLIIAFVFKLLNKDRTALVFYVIGISAFVVPIIIGIIFLVFYLLGMF
ncbi:hypothetical protein [Dysgonomonas macrotermitis]|uniref:Uncharacterized protein n=1 Tax=Dysgonomonas macrotermitis TaxID=1346286 RepID=A0A1M4ZCC6_9BACT|nr:hypothetical protein [Dysgonomonas macrotermitis]SHF15457.1 hypothetical protein SAMN05444362_10442 [Dysgonomonas macrotermitis]